VFDARIPSRRADEIQALRRDVEKVNWFHKIDLGDGVMTPGVGLAPAERFAQHGFPERFTGESVLDVGAWDGQFSFEAERRGARRVLATDWWSWGHGGWGTRAGFDLARRALSSRVEDLEIDVLDLSPARVGVFDTVIFYGVLYHMRHPLLALEHVASVTGHRLLLTTLLDMLTTDRPAAAFYPTDEMNGDFTNWWAPNPACLAAMLRDVGFHRIEVVREEPHGPRVRGAEGMLAFQAVYAWR
jgi:tRNA (mo5U34)-methyltransferase